MKKNDFDKFCEAWTIANELSVNGRIYSKAAMLIQFEDLEEYSLENINQALIRHRKKNKYFPTTSDVVEILRREAERLENMDNPFHQRFFGRSDERH